MVSADPTQVEQVLLNLCVNGYHAMTMMREEGQHQGGRLSIGLEKIYADRHFCERHPEAAEGHYWILSVNDTGVGMDTKTVAKIFDPFFTTKGKGKGTGLGLAVVYSIVQQHRGFIDVYSEAGAGSTFNVYLPAMSDEQAALAVGRGLAELPRGEGLVLVVDDEPVIREMAREMLEMCGYEVLAAENGEVALELFQQHRGR